VLDLEWNQAVSPNASVCKRLPFPLAGEIIQIGAVKLDESKSIIDELKIGVRPEYYTKMHYKVKKLTGFDKERLDKGLGFKQAFRLLREWCGDDCTFLTWGYDDQGIMEQNIIIHDLDWDWIRKWVNLQLIYNLQTGGDKNQKALKTAMEHFEILQTRVAHDALGDAYNAALVCSRLDMAAGLESYDHASELLARRRESAPPVTDPNVLDHSSFQGYSSRSQALSDPQVTDIKCPACGATLKPAKWVDQGDRRYMSMGSCREHGKYLIRLKFRRLDTEQWSVNRIIYRADDDMVTYYNTKAAKSNKRGRKRRKRLKLRPADRRASDTSSAAS